MLKALCCLVALVCAGACGVAQTAAARMKIKVVVVTTFEVGEDTGDAPGEFQYWVEREKLGEVVDFPGGVHPLRLNAAHDVLGVVTGMTLANAGPSIVALGMDPRFDLTHAYWLVDGIAGVDPADGTIGTAAWASFVVNDVNRQIDSAEMPKGWPYGLFVIGGKAPNEMPKRPMTQNGYALNAGLAEWAYGLTKGVKVPDNAAMAADRRRWVGFPKAMQAPGVILGDSFASDSYWHGVVMTRYANDWVSLWTKGKGNFAMANMEDSSIAEGLLRLDRMGKADAKRLMVLRVGSNYTMQAPGQTAVESVTSPYIASTAYEGCWVVGSVVVRELVGRWDRYEGVVPGR